MLTLPEMNKNEMARQYAIRVLRHNIVNMNLKPGQLISESDIGEQLGLSRTPVREAFKDLAKASVVEIFPQKGTFVSLIDMGMVEEARFLRLVLEKAVVELCCEYISEEFMVKLEENLCLQELCVNRGDHIRQLSLDNSFHLLLFEVCGKQKTFEFIDGIMVHFDRVRILNFQEMDMGRTVDDHKNILSAILKKDREKAVSEVEQHLSRILLDKSYLLDRHPEYFTNATK